MVFFGGHFAGRARALACSPRREDLETLTELVDREEFSEEHAGFLAMACADHHLPESIVRAVTANLGKSPRPRLVPHLMYELVCRGYDGRLETAFRDLRAELRSEGHPLAGLPLALLEIESRFPKGLPFVHARGGGHGYGILGDRPLSGSTSDPHPVMVIETTTEEDRTALLRLIDRGYQTYTAGTFDLAPPMLPHEFGPDLLSLLGLEPMPTEEELRESTKSVDATEACIQLFSACLNGGAHYATVASASFARLLTWEALRVLTGQPVGSDMGTIQRAAYSCAWKAFDDTVGEYPDTRFCSGVFALRPDGRSLAVLVGEYWS